LLLDCVCPDSTQEPSVIRNAFRHILRDYVESAVQSIHTAGVSQRRQRVGAIHNPCVQSQRVHFSCWSVDLVLSKESTLAVNIRNAQCDRRERCGDQQQSHARPCTRSPIFGMPRTVAVVSPRELRSNHTYIGCNPAAQTHRLAPTRMLSLVVHVSRANTPSSACGTMSMGAAAAQLNELGVLT